jgi:hypothetical protein
MVTKEELAEEAERRISEFIDTFGDNGFFEDGMIKALETMFQLSEIFFGTECAKRGFDAMVSCALPDGWSPDKSWREQLDDVFGLIYSDTHLGELLHDLTAYCDFGVVLTLARDEEKRQAVLASRIEQIEQLIALLPVEAWGLDGERLLVVIRKSLARWKLDNGEALSAEELAVLSGRAFQTIKNKLSGDPSEIQGTQAHIEAAEANAWLSRQKDFYPSIWKNQDDTPAIAEREKGMGEVAFVPVAKDGSLFHPGVKRDGKYLVDSDGAEQEFESFDEALAILQRAHFPEWRRPTPEGRWTRVRGVDWRRVPLDRLNAMPLAQA